MGLTDNEVYRIAVQNLQSSDPVIRAQAAITLGNLRDVAAVPNLLKALHDADADVCYWTSDALGHIAVIPDLVESLADPNPNVRYWVVVALDNSGNPLAIPSLVEALGDQERSVRDAAALALGKLGNPLATPALVEMLNSTFLALGRLHPTYYRPIEALKKIGTPEAWHALQNWRDEARNNLGDALVESLPERDWILHG